MISTVWGIYTKSGAVFDYNTVSEFDLDIECEDDRDLVHGTFTVYLQKNQPPEVTNLPSTCQDSLSPLFTYTAARHNAKRRFLEQNLYF